jgi:hypothetical protein
MGVKLTPRKQPTKANVKARELYRAKVKAALKETANKPKPKP